MKKVILGVFTILSISSLAAMIGGVSDKANTKWVRENFVKKVEFNEFKEWVKKDFATNVTLDRVKENLEEAIAELRNKAINDTYFEYVDTELKTRQSEIEDIIENLSLAAEEQEIKTDALDTELKNLKQMDEFFLKTDEALRSDIIKNKDEIIENKEGIKENREDIYENLELILNNSESIKVNATAINENKQAIETNKNSITENSKNIEINRNAIATMDTTNQLKFKELKHGVAMVAAMDAANLSAVNKGELEIAGGVATYAGKQAIAFGVAYAPINGLSLNLKSGFNFGKTNFWAASAGAKYKFNLSK